MVPDAFLSTEDTAPALTTLPFQWGREGRENDNKQSDPYISESRTNQIKWKENRRGRSVWLGIPGNWIAWDDLAHKRTFKLASFERKRHINVWGKLFGAELKVNAK